MKLLLVGLAGALVLAGASIAVLLAPGTEATPAQDQRFRGTVEPPGLTMPTFALRDQDGRLVESRNLRGKVVVLTFLDTKCREACPIIAGEIARAWKLLSPGEQSRSVAIAVSTDPRDDTPAAIRAFLRRHRATGTIRYLVGPLPVMRELWRRFLVLSSFESGDAEIHSAPVRIYDPELTWLAAQHVGVDLSPRNLAHDVRVALARS